MLTPTTELKLIYWQSRLCLIAMSILLKLSYIGLKLLRWPSQPLALTDFAVTLVVRIEPVNDARQD